MAVDYGRKFTCYSCTAKFYDLKKPKAVCPKCGADQADAPAPEPEEKKVPLGKSPVKVAPPPPPKKKYADDEDSDDIDEEVDEDFEVTTDDEDEEDIDETEDEVE